jgi:hypothetical protein
MSPKSSPVSTRTVPAEASALSRAAIHIRRRPYGYDPQSYKKVTRQRAGVNAERSYGQRVIRMWLLWSIFISEYVILLQQAGLDGLFVPIDWPSQLIASIFRCKTSAMMLLISRHYIH